MHNWKWLKSLKWYLLALACMGYALYLTYTPSWQYFVASFLYLLAGGLTWKHTEPTPQLTRQHIEQLRMQRIAEAAKNHEALIDLIHKGGTGDDTTLH